MSRNPWHTQHEDGVYTLARQWPPRFDVVAEADFPVTGVERLARQVRQDLWRAFRHLRGFSPVIQIAATDFGLTLRAGGRVMDGAAIPAGAENRIKALLDDPAHRARWISWAQERSS